MNYSFSKLNGAPQLEVARILCVYIKCIWLINRMMLFYYKNFVQVIIRSLVIGVMVHTYQSIVQQFINDGYILKRSLKESPIGENAKAICNCSRILSIKYAYISVGEFSICLACASVSPHSRRNSPKAQKAVQLLPQ